MKDRREIIEMLHREACSCVIAVGDKVRLCYERGVKDLLRLLKEEPEMLNGAFVADKVVGKGTAALMVLGGVSSVYADVVSRPALGLFEDADIEIDYGICVPNIINRTGTDICPVEKLCADAVTAHECLPLIEKFISEKTIL